MRTMTVATTILFAAISTTAFADQVTCESIENARNECEMNTRGTVRIVRQLSKSPCREGTDWGLSKHTVWVENGCRAVFINVSAGRDRGDHPRNDHRADDRHSSAQNRGGLPTFNATCPMNITVHGDEGGYIYINGDQANVKKINGDNYDATDSHGNTTISITKNPDETLSIMYTHGTANGICRIE